MDNVKFMVESFETTRKFGVLVNGKQLTTIEPKIENNTLFIGIEEKKDADIVESLCEIVLPCMNRVDAEEWSKLLYYYYEFIKYLKIKYLDIDKCDKICISYRGKELNVNVMGFEKNNILSKIEAWLDDILETISADVKLETIMPILAGKDDELVRGVEVNNVELCIDYCYEKSCTAKIISSKYGDFCAAFMLGALYNHNKIVKDNIDKIFGKYYNNSSKIESRGKIKIAALNSEHWILYKIH